MKAKKFVMYFMLVAMLASAALIVMCVSMAVMHIVGECNVACDALCVVMFIAFIGVNIFGREYNDIKDEIEMEDWKA